MGHICDLQAESECDTAGGQSADTCNGPRAQSVRGGNTSLSPGCHRRWAPHLAQVLRHDHPAGRCVRVPRVHDRPRQRARQHVLKPRLHRRVVRLEAVVHAGRWHRHAAVRQGLPVHVLRGESVRALDIQNLREGGRQASWAQAAGNMHPCVTEVFWQFPFA